MKIIIPTTGHVERMHTVRMLEAEKIPFILVAHTEETKKHILENWPGQGCRYKNILVSNTTRLVDKRNWILDNLVGNRQWFIGMDDNIREFTAVMKPYRQHNENRTQESPPKGFTWRQIYNAPISAKNWLAEFENNSVQRAKAQLAPLVGVATMENPYFRAKRWSNYRFVKTKVFAMRNELGLRFKHIIAMDSYLSALAVAKFGCVTVDSYLHYKAKMYEKGGLGTREEREQRGLLKSMAATCKEFPGLVMVGKGKNTALKFRLVTRNGVERWRVENKWSKS